MSPRRDAGPGPTSPTDERRPRTFLCRDDLYQAFEARARELECSVDWLLAEAMKRLLTNPRLAAGPASQRPPAPPPLRPSVPSTPPRPTSSAGMPLPPPPRPVRPARPTGSFVGPKSAVESIALRVGDVRTVLEGARLIVGRSARDAQIVVRDPNVSRQHAILERTADGWCVIDMASTNGVLLNGARVTRALLRPGDVLQIGPVAVGVERA